MTRTVIPDQIKREYTHTLADAPISLRVCLISPVNCSERERRSADPPDLSFSKNVCPDVTFLPKEDKRADKSDNYWLCPRCITGVN